MSETSKPVVVYVAGYGRSGSTWLDILLGAHPEVLSLGEMGRLWELAASEEATCVCGEPYRRCAQWGAALAAAETQAWQELRQEAYGLESWIRGARQWRHAKPSSHGAATAACLHHLFDTTGTRIHVDSTNTAYRFFWRPIVLRNSADLDVRMVHLVRDPRAVVASCCRGTNTQLASGKKTPRRFGAPIALVGWICANLGALINARLLGRGRYMRVHYEDLMTAPTQTLDAIGHFLDLDPEPLRHRLDRHAPFTPGHLVAGNRMARRGAVLARTSTPPIRLGWGSRLGCSLIAKPLYVLLRRRSRSAYRSASPAGL